MTTSLVQLRCASLRPPHPLTPVLPLLFVCLSIEMVRANTAAEAAAATEAEAPSTSMAMGC